MPKRKRCRKYYKELRDALPQEQVFTKSERICRQILNSMEYKAAETIFGYYPLGNEVNCLTVLEQALREGKRVVLPRTTNDYQMDFYEIKTLDEVETGHFHVREPKASCQRFVIDEEAMITDIKMLVLVPGVVFDRFGNRYGYGKGYYDRYFERFGQLQRMAPAYAEQLSESPLECLETDIKMHFIVTENEMIRIDV